MLEIGGDKWSLTGMQLYEIRKNRGIKDKIERNLNFNLVKFSELRINEIIRVVWFLFSLMQNGVV